MITTPIPYSNVELCRDKIAIILKQNLDLQYQYNYNPDAQVDKVLIEASNPNDFTELSLVEVGIDNVSYSDKNYTGAVTASAVINVDVSVKSATSAGTKGDSASRVKCTRLLNLCRYILEDPIYKTLGFEPNGFINGVSVDSIGMADPEKYDTQNVSIGRLVFNVIVTENNSLISGVSLLEAETQVYIGETEEGFKYVL
jgi:hypothetical protein